jgi:hypothetical protein
VTVVQRGLVGRRRGGRKARGLAVVGLAIACLAIVGLTASARADTKVFRAAQVQLDVRDDWKIRTGKGDLIVTDPNEELVIVVQVLEASALERAVKDADAIIKKSLDKVRWRNKPLGRDLNGMKAFVVAGTGFARASQVDIGALIVITPSNKPMLVYGVLQSSRAAQLQPQVDALVNSIRPAGGEPMAAADEMPVVTGFTVVYLPPRSARFLPMLAVARTAELELFIDALNQLVTMPRLVPIQVRECGKLNAYYSPSEHLVRVCYEFIDYFVSTFRPGAGSEAKARHYAAGAMKFTLMHELTHALTHELDLPIAGKEEDAADEFAAMLLTLEGERGSEAALAAAEWFRAEGAKKIKTGEIEWSDEHSFDLQRMYGIVCVLYGANPAANAQLVKALGMSTDRLGRCVGDYARKVKVWDALLGPHKRK